MVNLVASVISRTQLNSQMLVRSVEGGNLLLLIQNDSDLLIEGLCQMLKAFLCTIPRQMAAHPIYELVCAFLNNHLSRFHNINHEKIFYLWYIAIREYSPIHNCDRFYIDLFYVLNLQLRLTTEKICSERLRLSSTSLKNICFQALYPKKSLPLWK